jgi:hypothetical protein
MVAENNPNLWLLQTAAAKLEPLLDEIAFLGGCATGLLITDTAAAPVRSTVDVDVIAEIGSYAEYTTLEARLTKLGFRSRHEDKVICRWESDDLILDVMPTNTQILGFGNLWYAPALQNAVRVQLGPYRLRVISAPYFLATKIEAFHGRGHGDYFASHDIEDIIAVVDGRPELATEVRASEAELKAYLRQQFGKMVNDPTFVESIQGHLLPDETSQERKNEVLRVLRQFVTLD